VVVFVGDLVNKVRGGGKTPSLVPHFSWRSLPELPKAPAGTLLPAGAMRRPVGPLLPAGMLLPAGNRPSFKAHLLLLLTCC